MPINPTISILHPPEPAWITLVLHVRPHRRPGTARQLLSECAVLPRYVHKPGLRSGFGSLFFKRTHDRIHVYLQHTSRIPNATSVKGHVNDFLFDTRFVCFMGVGQLKTPSTGFAFVSLVAISAESFPADFILIAAVAARNSDRYHVIKTKSP